MYVRSLVAGIGVLALVSIAVTAVRVLGLAVDGPAAFTLRVLKPEIALVVLSTLGFLLESRRRMRGDSRRALPRAAIEGG